MCACVQFIFQLLESRTQTQGVTLPTMSGSSHFIYVIKTEPHRCPQANLLDSPLPRFSSHKILYCVKLTNKAMIIYNVRLTIGLKEYNLGEKYLPYKTNLLDFYL